MKRIKSVATWILGPAIIFGCWYWAQTLPPTPPSELVPIASFLGGVSLLLALYFLWRMKRGGSNFNFVTIWYYVRFTATLHFSVLVLCSISFDWFNLEKPSAAFWTILDTMLKGALLDIVESYKLDVSFVEPDSHLFWWRTISFLFRSAYSVVLPAVGYRALQLWKTRRESR